MTERPSEFGDFKEVGYLRLNFRLKSYVSRNIYGPLDREWLYTTTLPLEVSHKETL